MPQPDKSEIDTPHNIMERESISKEYGYDEEDDYHFAMSLVSAMKRVPNDRKLRMRMKILQILSEEGGANDSSVWFVGVDWVLWGGNLKFFITKVSFKKQSKVQKSL